MISESDYQEMLARLWPGKKPEQPAAPVVKPRRGRMNKWEARYAEHLEAMRLARQIRAWEFEPCKWRLADGAWYTPDFLVIKYDGSDQGYTEFHEVKGFWREAARVRIKVAADKYPYPFIAVTRERRTGEWTLEQFTGRGGARERDGETRTR